MLSLPLQIIQIVVDLTIFVFICYYFFHLRAKEAELTKKEGKIDTDYHQIVDTALAKERKILEDATSEADQIIQGARTVSQSVKDEVSRALQLMVVDIQKEAMDTAKNFTSNYQLSLKQLSTQSTNDFQEIVKGLKADLQAQISQFHQTLLPALEKELADYKGARLAQTESMVTAIIKKAAPEILNRSLSLEDHRSLVIESLEKAKKAGAFD
jgi:hypothetical protein